MQHALCESVLPDPPCQEVPLAKPPRQFAAQCAKGRLSHTHVRPSPHLEGSEERCPSAKLPLPHRRHLASHRYHTVPAEGAEHALRRPVGLPPDGDLDEAGSSAMRAEERR